MTGPASSQGDFVHLDQQDTSPHEGVMTGRGRSVDEAIAYGQSQIDAPTQRGPAVVAHQSANASFEHGATTRFAVAGVM